VIVWRELKAGLKVHVTEIGVDPLATLLKQPGIRFPAIEKVTLPATETDAVIVIEAPLEMESATVRPRDIGTFELFVIVRAVTLLS
jgi:hypothetical protein